MSENPFDLIPPCKIIDGFLGEEMVERLLAHSMAREGTFAPTGVGGNSNWRIDPEIRTSLVLRDFGGLLPELEARFMERMPWATRELRLSPIELTRCEIELVSHGDGAYYKRHIDTQTGIPDGKTRRALTGVLYFHALPKKFEGGEFRLFSLNSQNFIDIEPERDRLVLFPSWAPHEVRPVSCPSGEFMDSRFAINCWYRRRNPLDSGS
ncbi:MAG TPA: 2OG-Fe(II) oxygenase [Burkholderiales bacterium]|nr:2OG-Fe(II) oxygenase [Burkholderiales bacterium]